MLVTKLIQISQYCTIIIHKICNRCEIIQLGLKRMGTTQDRKKWRNRNTDILVKIVMVKHKPETQGIFSPMRPGFAVHAPFVRLKRFFDRL